MRWKMKWYYVVCAALAIGVATGCATSPKIYDEWHSGRPVITRQGPIEVATEVFEALQEGDYSRVENKFPSKEALASVFPASSPFVKNYDMLRAKLPHDFAKCLDDFPNMKQGKLLRVDGGYAKIPLDPDHSRFVEGYDNSHLFVLIDDQVFDIKLDEILKIDGAWYLVELPGKGRRSPEKWRPPNSKILIGSGSIP